MLAISLHATNDALRDELVPINKKYPLKELMAACRAYPGLSNARRITFEYVMLKGVNDSLEHARDLVKLLKGVPPRSTSSRSIPGRARNTTVPTGKRSRPSPISSTLQAMPLPSAPPAAATSWLPAAS